MDSIRAHPAPPVPSAAPEAAAASRDPPVSFFQKVKTIILHINHLGEFFSERNDPTIFRDDYWQARKIGNEFTKALARLLQAKNDSEKRRANEHLVKASGKFYLLLSEVSKNTASRVIRCVSENKAFKNMGFYLSDDDLNLTLFSQKGNSLFSLCSPFSPPIDKSASQRRYENLSSILENYLKRTRSAAFIDERTNYKVKLREIADHIKTMIVNDAIDSSENLKELISKQIKSLDKRFSYGFEERIEKDLYNYILEAFDGRNELENIIAGKKLFLSDNERQLQKAIKEVRTDEIPHIENMGNILKNSISFMEHIRERTCPRPTYWQSIERKAVSLHTCLFPTRPNPELYPLKQFKKDLNESAISLYQEIISQRSSPPISYTMVKKELIESLYIFLKREEGIKEESLHKGRTGPFVDNRLIILQYILDQSKIVLDADQL